MIDQKITTLSEPWTRSEDGIIAGVCQGLGKRFSIDPWIVRVALLVAVFAFGTGALAYLILALTLPRESEASSPKQKKFLGVCLQLSRQTGIDLGLLRALTAFSAVASLGITVVAYLVLYFILDQRSNDIVI